MNLFDSSFLCLDIGVESVRGIAHRVRSAHIDLSATHTVESADTVYAIKAVIDELEQQIGEHFDSAYITGNFGEIYFDVSRQETTWPGEHKITPPDIRAQIAKIPPKDDFYPMHIIPLRYDMPGCHEINNPIGQTDTALTSVFGIIYCPLSRQQEILGFLRRAHIKPQAFLDPHLLQYSKLATIDTPIMFIDFGAVYTTVSIWTKFGPVVYKKIPFGGQNITKEISEKFDMPMPDAERVKRNVANMIPSDMDRFTPADVAYEHSREDINTKIIPCVRNITAEIQEIINNTPEKYKPKKIIISGGGSEIANIAEFLEHTLGTPVENHHADANVQALSAYIWAGESDHREAYLARHTRFEKMGDRIMRIFHRKKKQRKHFVPIMPSTLCFDMQNPNTYTLFNSGDISMIHVDIMDGLYVDRIAGGIPQLKFIRAHTNAHLHVHLMTASPSVWADEAVAAGANTVILSTNTAGLRDAVRTVRAAGRRVGIALNPDSSVAILKTILRDIDEVMVMAVTPGAAGQSFNMSVLKKITILAKTREKYKLKFVISVDGGINAETAQLCWKAGADLLVSGSYLARASDFPLAVQSLLKKN